MVMQMHSHVRAWCMQMLPISPQTLQQKLPDVLQLILPCGVACMQGVAAWHCQVVRASAAHSSHGRPERCGHPAGRQPTQAVELQSAHPPIHLSSLATQYPHTHPTTQLLTHARVDVKPEAVPSCRLQQLRATLRTLQSDHGVSIAVQLQRRCPGIDLCAGLGASPGVKWGPTPARQ